MPALHILWLIGWIVERAPGARQWRCDPGAAAFRTLMRIADRLGVEPTQEDEAQTARLMQRTDVRALMDELGRRFP